MRFSTELYDKAFPPVAPTVQVESAVETFKPSEVEQNNNAGKENDDNAGMGTVDI